MPEKTPEELSQSTKAFESLPLASSSPGQISRVDTTKTEESVEKKNNQLLERLRLERVQIEIEKQQLEIEKQKVELKVSIQEKIFQRRLTLVQLVVGSVFKGSVGIIILIAGIQFTAQDKIVGPYMMGIGAAAAGISTKEASESVKNLLASSKKE